MATLTATEITRIRELIGDSLADTNTQFDLDDTKIQAEWDLANGHASEINEYKALYNMVRRRRGIWVNAIDTQSETGTSVKSQKLKQIVDLLNDYKALAGIGAFTMSTTQGTFDFGLDQDDPVTGADLED